MNELKLNVKTAKWFTDYVRIQSVKAKELIESGAPIELVQDQFEDNVRSAAFDAVEIIDDPSE